MSKSVIIFGTGKHALLVLNELINEHDFDQIYFFNNKEKKNYLKNKNKKYFIFKNFSKLKNKVKKFTLLYCSWIKFFKKKNI